MKKIIFPLVLLLIICGIAAGVWYFLLRPQPIYKAEDILPASTIALLQTPDIDQAKKDWDSSPLGKIAGEKEIQDFIRAPADAAKSKLAEDPKSNEMKSLVSLIRKLVGHFHGEAFLALLGADVTPDFRPQIVVGFDARDQARNAAQTIDELAAEMRLQYPKATREEKKCLGVKYETWSPKKNLVFCRARLGNLFLFATDEASLIQCIELAKGQQTQSLKKDDLFQKTTAKIDPTSNVLFYFNFSQVMSKLSPILAALPQAGSGLKDLNALKTFAAGSRFEPTGMTSKIFVLSPESEQTPVYKLALPWEKKSLPLVPSKTLLYAVTAFDAAGYYDLAAQGLQNNPAANAQFPKALEQFNAMLAAQNINPRNDLVGKLGKEFAVHLDWGEQEQTPNFFAMVETTDSAALLATLDRLLNMFAGATPAPKPQITPPTLTTAQVEGKTIHRFSSPDMKGFGLFYTDVDPFLIFTFQEDALPKYLGSLAKQEVDGFAQNPVFKSMAPQLPKTTSQFLFLDNKPLFEKIYNVVAPLAMLGAAMMPNQNVIDISKMPKTNTISQHLYPSVSYQYRDKDGFYWNSSGPFPAEAPFLGAMIGVGLTAKTMEKMREGANATTPSAQNPLSGSITNAVPPAVTPPSSPATNEPAAIFPPPTTESTPSFSAVERFTKEAACHELLSAVDIAKQKWAAANKAEMGATVFESQLKPYLDPKFLTKGKLVCPLGGEIIIGTIGQPARSTALESQTATPTQ